MNTNLSDAEIAVTDLDALYEVDSEEAENRLIWILMDPELSKARHGFLTRLDQFAKNDEFLRNRPRVEEDFSDEIAAIAEDGILAALRAGRISFARLSRMVCNPDALTRAYEAITEERLFQEIVKPRLHRPAGARRLGSLTVTASVTIGFSSGLASDLKDTQPVPAMALSSDGKRLLIRIPEDNPDGITCPYRLGVIRYKTPTGYVGKKFFFVDLNKKTRMYQADVVLEHSISKDAASDIDVWIISDESIDSDDAPTIDVEELDALRLETEVLIDDDLRAGLNSLKKSLEKN